MNDSEAIAKRVLEAMLPGTTLEYRLSQSSREYDFDLHNQDGTIAAVEETKAMNERHRGMLAAIYDPKKDGSIIHSAACQKSWIIFPALGASIDKIRANADRYLAKLEQEGIDNFFYVSSRTSSTRRIWGDLRIISGSVLFSEGQPTIEIGRPIGAGAVGPGLAIKVGEKEAWEKGNRMKLGAAKTAERHMVVYIPAGSLPWSALTSFEPPAILPKIPEEITNLWLIGQGENLNEFVVWYASTNKIWRSAKAACSPEIPHIQGSDNMR